MKVIHGGDGESRAQGWLMDVDVDGLVVDGDSRHVMGSIESDRHDMQGIDGEGVVWGAYD